MTIVSGLILFCGLQSAARADVTYSYTGSDFDPSSIVTPYSTNDYVSGSFTLDSALGAGMSLTDISGDFTGATPSGTYSFSDQQQTITSSSPPSDVTFKVSTDGSGNINGWFINLENPGPTPPYNQIFTESTPNHEDGGSSSGGGGYIFYAPFGDVEQPGWTESGATGTSPVPEPNMSWVLFGALTGGLAMMRLRRSKRQPE